MITPSGGAWRTGFGLTYRVAVAALAAAELAFAFLFSLVGEDEAAPLSAVLIFCGMLGVIAGGRDAIASDSRKAYVHFPGIFLQACLSLSNAYYLLLVRNAEESKLYRLGVSGVDLTGSFTSGIVLLSAAVAVGTAGTAVRFFDSGNTSRDSTKFDVKRFLILASIGVAGLLIRLSASRSAAFSDRGEASGQGLLTLLVWAAPVAVAYGVVHLHGKRKDVALVSALLVVGLFADGNRSPLLLIAAAFAVRLFRFPKVKTLGLAALTAVTALVLFALQTTWRADVRDEGNVSILVSFSKMISEPTRTAMRAGFDTVEGTGLTSYLLSLGYRPEWWDPTIAILNFIPRSLWSDKPTLFGSEIGVNVLGFDGAGGIFLSGPGYLYLLFGSSVASVTVYAILSALTVATCELVRDDVFVVIVLGTFVRFFLAGDPFDLFLGLQAAALYYISLLLTRTSREKDRKLAGHNS